jgi:hypothetical protein
MQQMTGTAAITLAQIDEESSFVSGSLAENLTK